jgi:radical S-adenosyl methionine domain-containing protein 2
MPLLKPILSSLSYPSTTSTALILLSTLALSILYLYHHRPHLSTNTLDSNTPPTPHNTKIPISVNYHFTRKCNATCTFCFHTATTSHVAPSSSSQHALRLLHAAGMKKLNFAGGEPFLYPKRLGAMCQFAKTNLALESVSIVSNGTLIKKSWLQKYGTFIDVLAISCDSFIPATNEAIGRTVRMTGVPYDNVKQLREIRDWCVKLGIKFKLNTVVCSVNWEEDMVEQVRELNPFRWKVFQVLIVDGENESEERIRDARKMVVSGEQFGAFCERHKGVVGFTPEPNSLMKSSYLVSGNWCVLDRRTLIKSVDFG